MITKYILSIACLIIFKISFSQEDYTIKMNMKIEGLPAEYAAFGEQETVTYLKGEKSKIEVSSMMENQITLFDGKEQTFTNDLMGNKMGYKISKEELESSDKKKKGNVKPTIDYINEKQNIAGFECNKAIITSINKDKKENKIIVWVTDKINVNSTITKKISGKRSFDLGDLKGFPLKVEMESNQNGMEIKILIIATEINTKPIEDSVFQINTDGFSMMSYSEYMEKLKGMQGGR